MAKKQTGIKLHLPRMIDASLLIEAANNSQKQSKHVFTELRNSIRENGFDEALLVIPRNDGEMGYWIVSGNHRFRAGLLENMTEFPCVVRDDWSQVQGNIEVVRRNYVRGAIDKEAFTLAVNALSQEASLPIATIMEEMGFEDEAAFGLLYQQQKKEEEELTKLAKEASTSDVGVVKLVADLEHVISSIIAKHGHTIPHSFIVFPIGNKNHMYVAANPSLKKSLQSIAQMALSNNLDINVALAGILAIGLDQTNFLNNEGTEDIIEAVDEEDSEDGDLELL